MPSAHSDYMPFLSTTYGRRWMVGDCRVHEDLYNEDCYVHGCGTGSPCANECCDHGWCTTPGADGCDSASGSFNGYTGSCKGSYACCSEDETGYENACREWGYPKEGEWNVDEDCCAGKKQMACADGYRLQRDQACYEDDCTKAHEYHCIACDPASACVGNLDEDGEDYGCAEDNVGLLILIICLPIGVVLICICIGCCICHSRRQAQQRQAQAAANAQMAHVQMAPVPKSYAYNTQQPVVQGAIVGEQQPVLQGVLVPSAPPIELQGVVVGEESR